MFIASPRIASAALMLFAALAGCAKRNVVRVPPPPGSAESGLASWYGDPYHGRPTASGEVYDMEQLTAAHRTLPFETRVEVTNLKNSKQVEVRITDRGPFIDGRIIDLSRAAARELDMLRDGVVPVRLRIVEPPASEAAYAVQAGAFADRGRAEALRDSLPFSDARILPPQGDPPLWRVLVGSAINMDEARRLAAAVKELTGDALVVPAPRNPSLGGTTTR
jgi:rare lipoprotein A